MKTKEKPTKELKGIKGYLLMSVITLGIFDLFLIIFGLVTDINISGAFVILFFIILFSTTLVFTLLKKPIAKDLLIISFVYYLVLSIFNFSFIQVIISIYVLVIINYLLKSERVKNTFVQSKEV